MLSEYSVYSRTIRLGTES